MERSRLDRAYHTYRTVRPRLCEPGKRLGLPILSRASPIPCPYTMSLHYFHRRTFITTLLVKGRTSPVTRYLVSSTPFTACTVRNVAAVPTLAQPLGPYLVQRNLGTLKPSIYVLYEVLSMFQLHPTSNKEKPTSPAWHGMEHQDVLPGGFLASLLCMQADASGSLYETLGGESYSPC